MVQLAEHPTVLRFRERQGAVLLPAQPQVLESAWLRQLSLDAGADDVGFVEVGRAEANPLWALARGKIRIKGSPKLLLAFSRCFRP